MIIGGLCIIQIFQIHDKIYNIYLYVHTYYIALVYNYTVSMIYQYPYWQYTLIYIDISIFNLFINFQGEMWYKVLITKLWMLSNTMICSLLPRDIGKS